jgi:Uma2 family endonuclease
MNGVRPGGGTIAAEDGMASHSPTGSKLTYAEYVLLPNDGRRHEIIDGEHHVNAAPNTVHQTVSTRLLVQLYERIELTGRGQVFHAPTDVQLTESDIVQPDLLVILEGRRRIITPTKVKGAPDLVVEITSEGTEKLDRGLKLQLYQRAGVPEYWVVDPAEHVVEQHALAAGRYELRGRHEASVAVLALPDVAVDLTRVW